MKSLQLAEKIKSLRLERAWSQAQLSEIASVSIRTIQRVELDGRCSHETLLAIASAFEVDVQEFTSLMKKSINEYSFYIFGLKFSAVWLKPKTAAVISFLLILPAFYFISASVLKYILGLPYLFDSLEIFYSSREILWWFNIISPAVFLIGLTSSLLINLFVMFSFKIWKENNTIHSDIIFKPKVVNIIISGISFLSLTVLLSYAVSENLILR